MIIAKWIPNKKYSSSLVATVFVYNLIKDEK